MLRLLQHPRNHPAVVVTEQPAVSSQVTVTAIVTSPAVRALAIPDSGVWIRIEYAGNYSASFGTSGRMKDVTGNGEHYYQIPAKDEIVDAFVQKLDGSADVMKVSIYNNGGLLKSDSTTIPLGTVEIHTDLKGTS